MRAILLVAITAILMLGGTAQGWNAFNDGSGNNCAECHQGSVIMAAHGGVSCLSCHVVAPGDTPAPSNCAVCHDAGDIVNGHHGMGIMACAMCHSELPNAEHSWGQVKRFWK